MKIKKGDKVIMLFHMIGFISQEEVKVETVHKNGNITLTNGFKFNTKNGKCLNDNTAFDAHRTLKIT